MLLVEGRGEAALEEVRLAALGTFEDVGATASIIMSFRNYE